MPTSTATKTTFKTFKRTKTKSSNDDDKVNNDINK